MANVLLFYYLYLLGWVHLSKSTLKEIALMLSYCAFNRLRALFSCRNKASIYSVFPQVAAYSLHVSIISWLGAYMFNEAMFMIGTCSANLVLSLA